MSDNIKVVVKIRPLIAREIEETQQHQWRVNNNTLFQLDSNGRDYGQSYTFDKVYDENTKTSDVYNDVAKPIVEAAVAGFNGTIFAYGQTSSGKTYTMTGTEESPGIIPLAVLNLFEIIKNVPGRDFVVSVSYIEIYNDTVNDLLDLKLVNIQQTHTSGIKIDATERVTASPEEVLETMKVGNANRQTAFTNMNESSSRSHSIFQISIESREHIEGEEQASCVNVSQLNLVDLAGSERAGQTGATGKRFKEGTCINKSLTSLALVIKQLSEDVKFVNYRDSKLTRILQNSLGGNAKTSIICAITPASLEETTSTLQFATRAKTITNKPEVNAVTTDATMIQRLTKQLSKLQSQLESKKNLEMILETKKNVEQDLQKQISNLQRFILNGSGRRPNVELMGAQRKVLPARRITISTLHPIEENENVLKVPKFSTPSLKYNPSLAQNAALVPIQNPSKLSSLPEEPLRLVTPPPNERKVNFGDEVIELDSDDDDDNTSAHTSCSPYHKCYSVNKTPPCVLRKNAKQADKNFKDLLELTEREKMYTPSVVELIEKIEDSNTKAARLQDEIEVFKTISKEKDLEIELLKSKINTTDNNIKSFTSLKQSELEAQRQSFNSKLTDWEVSYETLKNKAKLREQELLSLLEEQRIKQADNTGKMQSKPKEKEIINFMDMSKDMSLVSSDNENSISGHDEVESCERSSSLTKAQVATKNRIISDLEAEINAQKRQIEHFEKSRQNLLGQVDTYVEKLDYLENENALLRSTVNELNSSIKSHKENLMLAQNDMHSYKSVIAELQIKLTKKENLLDVNISDAVLESMLANEENTIANNENIKNIIHSLKLALENSKKEIDVLKSRIKNNNESRDKDAIDDKKLKLEMFNNEVSKLTKQANENMVTINTLLRDKKELALIEQELIKKLTEVEQKKCEYDILCKKQATLIDNLKKDNLKLETTLAEKNDIHNINDTLVKQFQGATNKIMLLEEVIKMKNDQKGNLNTQNNEFQDCLNKAQLAAKKLQDVFIVLTGDVREIPKVIDNVIIYNYINDNLITLETIAVKTMIQKDSLHNENVKLKNEIAAIVLHHNSQLSDIRKETENLNETIIKLSNDIKQLKEQNNQQSNTIEELKQELNTKNIDLNNVKTQLQVFKETDNNINAEISEKHLVISTQENEDVSSEKSKKVEVEVNNLTSLFKLQEKKEHKLGIKKEVDTQRLIELENKLQQKCVELAEAKLNLQCNEKANNEFVENIIEKLISLTVYIRQNNLLLKNNIAYENFDVWEHILHILDAVFENILLPSPIETQNKELKNKIEDINKCNKSLECDLKQSCEMLRQIQEELKIKVSEMNTMEYKAKECKKQLSDLDMSMKEQMLFLHTENEKLKTRCLESNNKTKIKSHLLPSENEDKISAKKMFTKSNAESGKNTENTLPSLFNICCNRIIEVIDQKQHDNIISATTSSSCADNVNVGPFANSTCAKCDHTVLKLRTAQQENNRLINIVEQLEVLNKELFKEHSEMSNEVHELLELTQELQKNLINHRTNLSILTATTYAENKSLKSQVKGLQHHHSRFHNVCQRDIPEFKKQLDELMIILKDNSSYCDRTDFGYKRSFLPNLLENNSTSCLTRNESTFDSDLLMLDTNVTVTTADNTLVGFNQTCLDLTQNMMLNETDFQTIDQNYTDPNILRDQMEILKNDNHLMCAKMEMLKEEIIKLKDTNKYLAVKELNVKDAQNSPIKVSGLLDVKDTKSQNNLKELEHLTEQLLVVSKEKKDIEEKYNDLLLEMPSTDILVYKMKAVEEDLTNKVIELSKTTDILNAQCKELKVLQDENGLLSTQVMEHISEVDDLNKEVEHLKQQNKDLITKCQSLELDTKSKDCPQCGVYYAKSSSKPNYNEDHSKINRSLNDSVTTSKNNKILTLQSEMHAGHEDCKVLTEDVPSIKHHLDHFSMAENDEGMNFELANDSSPDSPQSQKNCIPDVQEETPLDLYNADKNDCYNYYLDKTGVGRENFSSSMKIIEIMKLLHQHLVTSHGNEVENLANKLKDYQELHAKLLSQISDMNADHSKVQSDLGEKNKSLNLITHIFTQIRANLILKPSNSAPFDFKAHADILKVEFLSILDENFNLSSVEVFEQITDYTKKLIDDYSSVSNTLSQTKYHLSEKEKEYNLLKADNDKIREINNAVTLDIINKEKNNKYIIKETYHKLIELNMISPDKVPLVEPVDVQVLIRLLEHFINEYQKAKAELSIQINGFKVTIAEKEKHINELQSEYELLLDTKNRNANELSQKDTEIKKLKALQEELNSALAIKDEENVRKQNTLQNLSKEINDLRETLINKEQIIASLSDKDAKANELLNTVQSLQNENENLKAANAMISKETESYALELDKSCATIKQNNIDIDKMTSDILELREFLKEATVHMDKLKQEIQALEKENVEVKQELQIKNQDCSRLEINIKTHEKTAEIQSRMIMRLQKLKEKDEKAHSETSELTEKYAVLQADCEALRNTVKTLNEEIEHHKIVKHTLENRLAEVEETGRRSRTSIDAIADSSKRRRQSLHDSKRLFDELEDHKNLEAVFESRQKSDDFFDIHDEDSSGRSTPFGLGKGRDNLLSRTNHSDKDDEHPSRPSSVLASAARRRRQSSHDLHRSVTPQAPSPTDLSTHVIDELQQLTTDKSRNSLLSDNEVTQLRSQLASCEQELEELKERYRELDQECETCAEYLHERDEQCIRLKKEKTALEKQVMELKLKAESPSNPINKSKPIEVAHVSVNTDEDWTNLHAVVVDRMSFDAEVEKNKKLTKTIDELRFTKHELKNTLAKMQKALEKSSAKDNSRELEQIRKQLKASNDELKELRARCKELDDECETCASHLKEREEQCRRLKEAKATLEAKLEEIQDKSHALEHSKCARKKRQTVHDMNRPETSAAERTNAFTETTDDLLSSQVERDDSTQVGNESSHDSDYFKEMVKRLTEQKMSLEMQLRNAQVSLPMFVATGSAIVQNQQITDVMKENQKLKTINAKLINICKKRGKSANRENEDPCNTETR